MAQMLLFVCGDGDSIGQLIGRATLEDDSDKIRQISQLIQKGNELWQSFAIRVGGNVITCGGDEITIAIPATALGEVSKIREQYHHLTGHAMSIGIGLKLSEAAKALLVAKLRGKDRIVLFTPELGKEIQDAQENAPDETQKIVKEYLSKANTGMNIGTHAGFVGHSLPIAPDKPSFQGPPAEPDSPPPPPEGTHAEEDFEEQLHSAATNQAAKDKQELLAQVQNNDELKMQVAEILQGIKQQAPLLQQIKASAPQVYDSIMRLVQAVIAMAHELKEGQPNDPKGEAETTSLHKSLSTPKMLLDSDFADMSKAMPKVKTPEPEPQPDLAVVHNLSQANLAHAHKLGGLAMPSLAVTHSSHGFTSFGEVSLVAHPSMIDPATTDTKVFGSDVYSSRHPRSKFEVKPKEAAAFKKWFHPHAQKIGSPNSIYDVEEKLSEGGAENAAQSHRIKPSLQLAWLEEKGHHLEPPMKDPSFRWQWMDQPAMRSFFKQHGIKQLPSEPAPEEQEEYEKHHVAMTEAADAAIKQWSPEGSDEERKTYTDHLFYEDEPGKRRLRLNVIDQIHDDVPRLDQKEVDTYAFEDQIKAKVKELGGEDEYHRWAVDKLRPLEGKQYIPKHSPNTGNVRKVPYNLDNVLKEMGKKIRGAEGFNYGLGTARSHGSKQFRSLDQLKAHKHKLVPKAEFDKHKEENSEAFSKLTEKMDRYHSNSGGFGVMGALADAIGESYRHGKSLHTELKACGFNNVPHDLINEVRTFAQDLVNMPTEYFEAKPQRAVGIHEFKGAAVPENVSAETLAILAHHGIKHIERYKTEGTNGDHSASRAAAVERIARAQGLMLNEMDDVKKSAEALEKMAIRDLKPGVFYNNDKGLLNFDYTHLLPQTHRQSGEYKLTLTPLETDPAWRRQKSHKVKLFHKNKLIGTVEGYTNINTSDEKSLEPHSSLHSDYHGRGLGTAMYEALYSHAFSRGIKNINGGIHTEAAERTHTHLAAKHGLDFTPSPPAVGPGGDDIKDNQIKITHGPYKYTLKEEMNPNEDLDKYLIDEDESGPLGPSVKKSIEDLGIGKKISSGADDFDDEQYDYSHLLPLAAKHSGYKVHVNHAPDVSSIGGHVFATVLQGGREVGALTAEHREDQKMILPAHTKIDEGHRGQGLGMAMYEALYTHAKKYLGAESVSGTKHSTSVHGIHKKLSAKHGMSYKAVKIHDQPAKDFDGAYGSYHYHLKEEMPMFEKSEELEKMALADIRRGARTNYAPAGNYYKNSGKNIVGHYDYSHILPKEHQDNYKLVLSHGRGVDGTHELGARIHYAPNNIALSDNTDVGVVAGYFHGHDVHGFNKLGSLANTLRIRGAELHPDHHGKSLGMHAYEALLAHAKNELGATHAVGNHHSTSAHRTWEKLAAKHGLSYTAEQVRPTSKPPGEDKEGSYDSAFGPYTSTLKAEMEMEKAATPHAVPKRENLHLPVGTINNRKIKVKHADGKESWVGVAEGMIAGQEPGVPQGGGANSHPVSSIRPGAK